jgi:hypothetical protein
MAVPYKVDDDTFAAEEPVPWSAQRFLDIDVFRSMDVGRCW